MKPLPLVEIWAFDDTPPELQALSTQGGDEDFVVIIRDPDFDGGDYQGEDGKTHTRGMGWFNFEDVFLGVYHWQRHELPNGEVIWFGSHA